MEVCISVKRDSQWSLFEHTHAAPNFSTIAKMKRCETHFPRAAHFARTLAIGKIILSFSVSETPTYAKYLQARAQAHKFCLEILRITTKERANELFFNSRARW